MGFLGRAFIVVIVYILVSWGLRLDNQGVKITGYVPSGTRICPDFLPESRIYPNFFPNLLPESTRISTRIPNPNPESRISKPSLSTVTARALFTNPEPETLEPETRNPTAEMRNQVSQIANCSRRGASTTKPETITQSLSSDILILYVETQGHCLKPENRKPETQKLKSENLNAVTRNSKPETLVPETRPAELRPVDEVRRHLNLKF